MVELVIIAPLLVLLFVSVVDLSLQLREQFALAEAIQIGGRTASLQAPGTSPGDLTDRALDSMTAHLTANGFRINDYRFDAASSQIDATNAGPIPAVSLSIRRVSPSRVALFNSYVFPIGPCSGLFTLAWGNSAEADQRGG